MIVPLSPIRCMHRAVDLYGNKIGIVSGDLRFTYAEFGRRCERLATALTAEGIRSGDRVAYLSFNNHQLLEGYFGVIQAGAIVTPLNVRLTPAELTAILNHSGARMLLFENDFAPLVAELRPVCPCIEKYVAIDEKTAVADFTYEELLDRGHPGAGRYFPLRRKFDRRAVLHQRQHGHAEGRHALASHALSARAVGVHDVPSRR